MGADHVHPLGVVGRFEMNAVGGGGIGQIAVPVGEGGKTVHIPAAFVCTQLMEGGVEGLDVFFGEITAVGGFFGADGGEGQHVDLGVGLEGAHRVDKRAVGLGEVGHGHADLVDAQLQIDPAVLLGGQSLSDGAFPADLVGNGLLGHIIETYAGAGQPPAAGEAAVEI